eukprot:1144943-Pelagomonas_calceolata.AAC.1
MGAWDVSAPGPAGGALVAIAPEYMSNCSSSTDPMEGKGFAKSTAPSEITQRMLPSEPLFLPHLLVLFCAMKKDRKALPCAEDVSSRKPNTTTESGSKAPKHTDPEKG